MLTFCCSLMVTVSCCCVWHVVVVYDMCLTFCCFLMVTVSCCSAWHVVDIFVVFQWLQLLAVVYDTFSNLEKSKLRALFLHKREACMHAFRLLVTTKVGTGAALVPVFLEILFFLLCQKSFLFSFLHSCTWSPLLYIYMKNVGEVSSAKTLSSWLNCL